MLESFTPDSLFARIMMDESGARAFFLVEGPDENSIFCEHIPDDVSLIVCGGKENVLGTAEIVESNSHPDVYGLVDSDFDRFQEGIADYPNHIVATDSYDLIADIVLSSPRSLRRALSAHGADSVQRIEDSTGKPVDHLVFGLTTKLAAVKLAARRNQYQVSFRDYDFLPLVDRSFELPGVDEILDHGATRSPAFTPEEIHHEAARSTYVELAGRRDASGGHDIVSASLALLMRGGAKIPKKTISGTFISIGTCQVLASLACIRQLSDMALNDSGVDIFDCASIGT